MLWEHVAAYCLEGGTELAKSKDNHDPVKRTKNVGEAVESELHFDPLVDATGITVKNLNGDVALNGTVIAYPQYLQAARAGKRVQGVTRVHNHVMVTEWWGTGSSGTRLSGRSPC